MLKVVIAVLPLSAHLKVKLSAAAAAVHAAFHKPPRSLHLWTAAASGGKLLITAADEPLWVGSVWKEIR